MTKKLFLLVSIIFAFLFISSFSFAANTTANPVKDTVNGLTGGAANAVNHAANAAGAAGTARTHVANPAPRASANNTGYTATRTTAGAIGIMNNNVITWVILAVAAIIIISLVWYYAVQDTDRRR